MLKFPVVRNLSAKEMVTKNVAPLIETIVNKALLCDPIAIKVRAKPKPAAAPKARRIGLIGKPCDNSGPLAQNTPINAITTPTKVIVERTSPVISA